MSKEPLMAVRGLEKRYPITEGLFRRQVGVVRAVDGISFDVERGETLGLVGESGCGKSTAANSIVRLEEPTGGEVVFNGNGREGATRNADGTHPNDVTRFDDRELESFRRGVQMVFQDPSSSFDPRMTVGDSIAEPLRVQGMDDRDRRRRIVEDLLDRVGLSASDADRYPHEFSGGQKQRLALARALVLNPDLVIADEPVSALDVSIKAEILELLDELQSSFELSLLLISHDMSVVREVCDRVAVMYLGEIVEIGPVSRVFTDPKHPYTEALLSSVPTPDPRADPEGIELEGTVPSPSDPPSGCRFHTRCHRVIQPAGLDVDQSVWRGSLNLRELAESGTVDVAGIRERLAADPEADVTDAAVKARIRSDFGLPSELSSETAERALSRGLDRIVDGEFEAAADALSAVFTTPCEETVPERIEHGSGHESACLLHTRDDPGPGADVESGSAADATRVGPTASENRGDAGDGDRREE